MAEYETFTREQLLEELRRKEAVKEKFRNKLVQIQEKCANFKPLVDSYESLKEEQKQRVQEYETLRSRNSILEKAHQDADSCVKEQDRRLKQLAHSLRQSTECADKAEQSSKQAKADSAQSAMVRKKLEHNLDDLKKQLLSLESALTTVKKQQQDDQNVVTSMKAQASKPAEARAHAPNGACQGCTVAQRAVEELRQQMAPLQMSLSVRGSNLAESMPSTQDRSGDTNDDRDVAQLRSELSGIRHQLAECHEQQGKWLVEMQGWRNAFALLGGVMPSAHIQAPQQTASEQRQVSPVAAEGSNIMPRLAFRPDPAEVGRPCQGSSPPNGAHAPRESTPQAGSTAGDGEDVGRHDTLGAGSDSMSNVAGTAASLMQPARHQPQHALRLLPSQAQPRAQGLSAGLLASRPLHTLQRRLPAEPDSGGGLKEKRRTIALNPGPMPNTHNGRKRKRPAPKGTDPPQQQQQPAEQRVDPSEPQQLQQQPQSQAAPDNAGSQTYLAKFGIQESDATVVDFLELQLARITHSDEELGPELVSSVAQDICSAWQQSQCPLQCIISAFVCSFLECVAAPYAHSLPASKRSRLGEASQDGEQEQDQEPNTELEAEESSVPVEDGPMARLWCSSAARRRLTFTWLQHCANELDGLLSSPPPPQPHPQAQAQAQAAAKGTPSVKRRGRPPGSKNKKTLQRLQQAGLSLPQQQQQQQQELRPDTSPGSGKAVMRLKPCDLLNGLLQQVLHFLRQSCQVLFPGPFQTEVCCLSATAAALCRLTGKSAVLRAQVLNALRDPDMSAGTKLLCTTAALETWPTALVPSLDPNMCDDILMQCTLAALHGLVASVQQDTSAAQSASAAQPDLSALPAPHPGQTVTAEDRSKLALQDWGHNPFTQTAASQLDSMYAQHWQQQQQPQSRRTGKDTVISCPPEHADTFWSTAVPSVAANLQCLCIKGELSESCLQTRWTCLHHALELAISCLGWRWGFEQVTGTLMGQIMRATLPAASEDDTWALSTMGHLLRCMKHAAGVIAQVSCKKTSCYSALKGLAETLRQAAKTYVHHQGLHDLLNDAADAVKGSLDAESHQVPESHQPPQGFLNGAAAGTKASIAGCQIPAEVSSAAHEMADSDTDMLQQVEDIIAVPAVIAAENCKAAALPKYESLGVEVEEI
ncbi:hypothetical protein WJX77_007638 [Trebouxia sp. C0004]